MKNIVLTEQSILNLANTIDEEIIERDSFPNSDFYLSLNYDKYIVLLTGNDKDKHLEHLPFILIDSSFFNEDIDLIKDALFTIHSAVVSFNQNKNLRKYIPNKKFCENNLLVLEISQRYIYILVNITEHGSIYVFSVKDKLIKEYSKVVPNELELIKEIDNNREKICTDYREILEHNKLLLSDNYNFDLFFGDKKQQNYTYKDWEKVLTNKQRTFLEKNITNRLILSGPAGTGKTLLLELKIIKLLTDNPELRILFTCHSWAVAIQVNDFLSNIDISFGTKVDSYPLLALAQEQTSDEQLKILTLGDDSYTGKIEQIKLLNRIIQDFKKSSDWNILKNSCSDRFIKNIESISDSNNNYTWDIMIEISCTLCANGIMDDMLGFEKYNKIERHSWMLPLENECERKVVYIIYSQLLSYLDTNNIQTTDMIFNDYLNYLSGFSWNKKRKTSGYDYIFIDEMQLFNYQEKSVLNYLTRNTKDYPKIIMAMDPKQSVDMIYSDFGVNSVFVGEQSLPDSDNKICLDEAFRYTRQVLKFLKHIDFCYPEMGFGDNWNNNIKNIESKQADGEKPQLYLVNSNQEIKTALKIAKENVSNKRIAILTLQDSLFIQLQNELNDDRQFKIIDAMSKSHALKYVKQNIYISKPSYVIGLQFDIVILIGCYSIYDKNASNTSFYRRRFLSDLYLGASRTKVGLYLIGNKDAPFIPDVIQKAVDNKIIELNKSN